LCFSPLVTAYGKCFSLFSQVFMGEPCVQGTPWKESLFLGIAAKRNRTDGYGFLAGLSDSL